MWYVIFALSFIVICAVIFHLGSIYGIATAKKELDKSDRELSKNIRAGRIVNLTKDNSTGDPSFYIFSDRTEAERVLNELKIVADRYGMVRVSDYYDLIGVTGSIKDLMYGWTNVSLSKAQVVVDDDGYVIQFPRTEHIPSNKGRV